MRRAAKIDANQAAVVKALRAAGYTVTSLAQLGKGVPDLLVGKGGMNFLLEVKDGSLSPSRRCLTADECDWAMSWLGQVAVVLSPAEAIEICEAALSSRRRS